MFIYHIQILVYHPAKYQTLIKQYKLSTPCVFKKYGTLHFRLRLCLITSVSLRTGIIEHNLILHI